MSYAKVLSVGLVGVRGHLVEVEADLANGLPMVALSGLPDTALNEARDRVRAAIVNSGRSWPQRRITVNLRPAALPKHGSGFDATMRQQRHVDAAAQTARELRAQNHFGEQIEQALRRRWAA